jgi:WD40 repeat protein
LTNSKIARIWSFDGRAISPPLEQGNVTSVGFSPDGTRVVTSSEDSMARICDATTGKLIVPPLEHQARVLTASFSPDGARVVTTSEDRTARVWDAITGAPLTLPLPHGAPILAAAFSSDGARVVTADRHAVRTWDVSLDPGSFEDWSRIAARSPYVLRDGVLILRSLASEVGSPAPLPTPAAAP